MAESIFALPVSLGQVAVLIKQMHPADRRQLLQLVPELRQEAMQTQEMLDDARETVEILRQELLLELGGQPLSTDEPFLGDFTLGEYLSLPEAERAKLWDEWSEIDLEALEELEVQPNAVPAR